MIAYLIGVFLYKVILKLYQYVVFKSKKYD